MLTKRGPKDARPIDEGCPSVCRSADGQWGSPAAPSPQILMNIRDAMPRSFSRFDAHPDEAVLAMYAACAVKRPRAGKKPPSSPPLPHPPHKPRSCAFELPGRASETEARPAQAAAAAAHIQTDGLVLEPLSSSR
jgi:hypothetical protein